MSIDKKKKKLQMLDAEVKMDALAKLLAIQQSNLKGSSSSSGSIEYIANREIDQIIKKGRERLKHAITVSDIKLTKTKKQIIKEMAEDMEKANYPVDQICDRLAKSLKGLVHDRTVRDALDSKYKNPVKSGEASQQGQNNGRGINYRDQQQVLKKPVEQITLEDLKNTNVDFPKSKLRQLAKHLMQRALFFEQQAKQWEEKYQDLVNLSKSKTTKKKEKVVSGTIQENMLAKGLAFLESKTKTQGTMEDKMRLLADTMEYSQQQREAKQKQNQEEGSDADKTN